MASFKVSQADVITWASKGIVCYSNGTAITVAMTASSVFEFTPGAVIKFVVSGGTFSSVFLSNPILEIDYYFALSLGNTVATLSAPNSSVLNLSYMGAFGTVIYTFTSADVATWAANNFTLSLGGVLVTGGGNIFSGQTILMTGTNGYIIQSASFYSPISDTNIPLTVAVGGATATGTITSNVSTFNYSLKTGAVVNVRGSNSVYVVADEDLQTITSKRFVAVVGQDTVLDYGKFMLGLIRLPFVVPVGNIVGTEEVLLGPVPTGVFAGLMNTDRLAYSLGSIVVPATNGNALDFAETKTLLHLPYCNPVVLDIDYAIGKTVSIDLVISMYDGSADYNISSTKLGGVVVTNKVALDIKIPFSGTDTTPNGNSPASIEFGVDNGVRTAYIEVKRNAAVLPAGVFTAPVVVEGVLSAVKGFVVVENIALAVKATTRELDMLSSILKSGIHIT